MTSAVPRGDVFPAERSGYIHPSMPIPDVPNTMPSMPPPQPPYMNRSPGDSGPIGCALLPSGQDYQSKPNIFTKYNRGFPGDSFPNYTSKGPIYIAATSQAQKGGGLGTITPMYGDFAPELWKTPYNEYEEKESLGYMVNAGTGEIAELFQDAMPPPNTDKSLLPSSLKRTNPWLTALQGGNDPNNPRPNKKEIAQYMPGSDYGPNPWGDQLYENQRRDLFNNLVMRDVYNHKNGIFPCEQLFNKELPAGFVGYQDMMRWVPWMPPTQQLDIAGWMQHPGNITDVEQSGANPLVTPFTFTKRNDLTAAGGYHPGIFDPNSAVFQPGDYVPAEEIILRDTKRGLGGDEGRPEVDYNIGNYVVLDYVPRQTRKDGVVDQEFPDYGANIQIGDYVVQDTEHDPAKRAWTSVETRPNIDFDKGDYGGSGAVFFKNYRGYNETYEEGYHPTKIFEEAGDTMARWVSQTERDPRTDMAPNMGMANFTQGDGPSFMGRYPEITYPKHNCKLTEDETNCYVNAGSAYGGIYQSA